MKFKKNKNKYINTLEYYTLECRIIEKLKKCRFKKKWYIDKSKNNFNQVETLLGELMRFSDNKFCKLRIKIVGFSLGLDLKGKI